MFGNCFAAGRLEIGNMLPFRACQMVTSYCLVPFSDYPVDPVEDYRSSVWDALVCSFILD